MNVNPDPERMKEQMNQNFIYNLRPVDFALYCITVPVGTKYRYGGTFKMNIFFQCEIKNKRCCQTFFYIDNKVL